jgi:hypothetical protein
MVGSSSRAFQVDVWTAAVLIWLLCTHCKVGKQCVRSK